LRFLIHENMRFLVAGRFYRILSDCRNRKYVMNPTVEYHRKCIGTRAAGSVSDSATRIPIGLYRMVGSDAIRWDGLSDSGTWEHQMFDATESMVYHRLQHLNSILLIAIHISIKFNHLFTQKWNSLMILRKNLFEQNQMEIEYQLYHLYVHSIFFSNFESFLRINKHIYRSKNRYFPHFYRQVIQLFTLIPDGTIDHYACKWIDHCIK